jgi:hypothetical protein
MAFVFGTIRSPLLQFPLSNLFKRRRKKKMFTLLCLSEFCWVALNISNAEGGGGWVNFLSVSKNFKSLWLSPCSSITCRSTDRSLIGWALSDSLDSDWLSRSRLFKNSASPKFSLFSARLGLAKLDISGWLKRSKKKKFTRFHYFPC